MAKAKTGQSRTEEIFDLCKQTEANLGLNGGGNFSGNFGARMPKVHATIKACATIEARATIKARASGARITSARRGMKRTSALSWRKIKMRVLATGSRCCDGVRQMQTVALAIKY